MWHQARTFKKWLASWDHPGMCKTAHCTYGFNPGAKRCNGEIGHHERVFGCARNSAAELPARTPPDTLGAWWWSQQTGHTMFNWNHRGSTSILSWWNWPDNLVFPYAGRCFQSQSLMCGAKNMPRGLAAVYAPV